MKFLAVLVTLFSLGCKPAIRDAAVYKSELDFVDAASQESVDRGKALIASSCTCEETDGDRMFVSVQCEQLAETIVVMESRMKYHTDFMRYLGGLSDVRPPKEPPDVPDADSLCDLTPPVVPVRQEYPEHEQDTEPMDTGDDR